MRILSLMQIKNVIQVTGLIKPGYGSKYFSFSSFFFEMHCFDSLVLQLIVVVVNFVSAWLTASGCFHLVSL